MNRKSRLCIFTCGVLLLFLGIEIFYLQYRDTLTHRELAEKKEFIKITTISNVNLALKNNYIKTYP